MLMYIIFPAFLYPSAYANAHPSMRRHSSYTPGQTLPCLHQVTLLRPEISHPHHHHHITAPPTYWSSNTCTYFFSSLFSFSVIAGRS